MVFNGCRAGDVVIQRISLFSILVVYLQLFGCGGGGVDTYEVKQEDKESVYRYKIAGKITASRIIRADSDSNDPGASHQSNDTAELAQAIAGPAIIGGFISASPSGVQNDYFGKNADSSDWYQVDLLQGQAVVLVNNADSAADFDLDLYVGDATSGALKLASAAGLRGATYKKLIIEQPSGRYKLQVSARSGGGNYLIYLTPPENPMSLMSASGFVSGQLLVTYKNSGAQARGIEQLRAQGIKVSGATQGGAQLLLLGDTRQRQSLIQGISSDQVILDPDSVDSPLLRTLDTWRALRALQRNPDVARVALNYRRNALTLPNDPYLSYQWNLPLINMGNAWDVVDQAKAQADLYTPVVAVLDTGVALGHEDIKDSLLRNGNNVVQYDFVSDLNNADDGDGADGNANDPVAEGGFHGTHVSGIVAAATNNALGIAGVAASSGAQIMPVRVLGKDGGEDIDVAQGIRYAACLLPSPKPARCADVINMSLGGEGGNSPIADAVSEAIDNGVIVVAAAGNSATAVPSYPAAYPGVISVSAVDVQGRVTPYSNYGVTIDVAAPGGNFGRDVNLDGFNDGVLSSVLTEDLKPTYKYYPGTSMAAPHVAGVIAMMKAVYQNLSPQEVNEALAAGVLTHDVGETGLDIHYGHGMIDAYKAVRWARDMAAGVGGLPAYIKSDAAQLRFESNKASLILNITQGGGGSLNVDLDAASVPSWLSVTVPAGDTGLGAYQINAVRNGLESKTYQAVLVFNGTDNNGAASVFRMPVQLVHGDGGQSGGDPGHQWVILLAIDKEESHPDFLRVVEATLVNGEYRFDFGLVPKARYVIFSTSDFDHDYYICDVGETCGLWGEEDDPVINLTSDQEDLQINTYYTLGVDVLGATSKKTRFVQRRGVGR